MYHILEELRVFGCMGIVTTHAIHGSAAYPEMGLDKRSIAGVMALCAQCLDWLSQEAALRGEMGFMARLAILLCRRMALFPGQFLFYRLMAIQAEIRALRQEQFVELGLVGTVALRAVAVDIGGMLSLCLLESLVQIRMAGCAQFIFLIDDHPRDIAGMGIVAGQAFPAGKRHMVCPQVFRFHQVGMARRAQLRDSRFEELFLFGAVGLVAGGAVIFQYRLMDYVLFELVFRIAMTAVTDRVHPVLQHPLEIGPVRVMTGGTVSSRKRFMDNLIFHCIPGFCMAGITQVCTGCDKKPLICGRVGLMAGKTSLTLQHRVMFNG
jgi:hypothetical protein